MPEARTAKTSVPFPIILLVNLAAVYLPSVLLISAWVGGVEWFFLAHTPVASLFVLADGGPFMPALGLTLLLFVVVLLSVLAWWRSRLISLPIVGALFFYGVFQALFAMSLMPLSLG